MSQIINELEDWTVPIRTFKRNFARASQPEDHGKHNLAQELNALGIVVARDGGAESLLLQQQIVTLSRVIRRTNAANVNNVLANIELASLATTFNTEDWGAAEDTETLHEVMKRYVPLPLCMSYTTTCPSRHGLSVASSDFFAMFGADKGKSFFARLRLCCQLVCSVSPIVVFIPKQWSSQSIRRDHLIAVRISV